ncbi:MAG: hypothetical protein AVDCRST_MAG96-311 [uncultured Segetibacter sp.]|uniref:Uncharacterized protein n=1 Tax=uncultured Segetibacter sp. TaxID=481133 RepID=A0A6J4RFA9_9BACT|nr:MAG: hypothetical protein AVDCRST_MAG96-311 [uncultured Segetibacter sp.]
MHQLNVLKAEIQIFKSLTMLETFFMVPAIVVRGIIMKHALKSFEVTYSPGKQLFDFFSR